MSVNTLLKRVTAIAAILLIVAGFFTAPLRAADNFGYTATGNVAYSYVDVSTTGTAVLANADDATALLTLPFGFRFYGVTYTSLCASTNGLIAFGGCPTGDITNLDLTVQSPTGNLPLIAPFWMDLTFAIPGAGSIIYQTLGAEPARRFVAQWKGAFALNQPSPLDFQVILYEGTNQILFQYQNVETANAEISKGKSATVGIRATDGQANGNRVQWSYRTAVLTNRSAIRFEPPTAIPVTIDLKPDSNPNCVNPTSRGTVPVAIFGTSKFAVADIDQSKLRFGGAAARSCAVDDVGTKDGLPDLVCHFETTEVTTWPAAGADCGKINLTGSLKSGFGITGSDIACRVAERTCKAGPTP